MGMHEFWIACLYFFFSRRLNTNRKSKREALARQCSVWVVYRTLINRVSKVLQSCFCSALQCSDIYYLETRILPFACFWMLHCHTPSFNKKSRTRKTNRPRNSSIQWWNHRKLNFIVLVTKFYVIFSNASALLIAKCISNCFTQYEMLVCRHSPSPQICLRMASWKTTILPI